MQNLKDGTRDWLGAVIIISGEDGGAVARPAAFVFDVPGGLAWVEPSYADPMGAASPSFHRREGERESWNTIKAGSASVSALPYEPAEDADLVGDALDWFADWMKAEGRTWAQERERVREMLGDSLA